MAAREAGGGGSLAPAELERVAVLHRLLKGALLLELVHRL